MNKKNIILCICICIGLIITFIIGLLLGIVLVNKNNNNNKTINNTEKIDNIDVKYFDNDKYYIITGDYNGDYDYQKIDLNDENSDYDTINDKIKLFNTTEILNYTQYDKYCKRWNLKQKYNNRSKDYLVISYASFGQPIIEARLANVIERNGKVTVYMWDDADGVTADVKGYSIIIPVDRSIYTKEIISAYTEEEFYNIQKYNTPYDPNLVSEDKPIIYIYPKDDTKVTVKLSNPELLTVSYPKYNNSWNVLASPNGNLKDLNTNKNYYGLYYESSNHKVNIKNDGFIIEGKNIASFLEEKLSILGLNEKESNEFIIYWLPKLENNKYNYIRFETQDEINNYMSLDINPKPDTLIRIIMDFKPLDEKINIKEQVLTPVKRQGYTVVEWGGSKIK